MDPSFPLIVDGHQDLAYNALTFGRDYRRAAHETRALEEGTPVVQQNEHTQVGWPDFQRGQYALIFATLFLPPPNHAAPFDTQVARDAPTTRRLWRKQVDYYQRLAGENPAMFRLIANRAAAKAHFAEWDQGPAVYPSRTHPTALTLLIESAEGIGAPRDLEEWWEAGVRIVGPVWAGERFCGGMYNPAGSFTREGYELLEVMAGLGLILDVSHMNEKSMLQALDRYEGTLIASHANVRALLQRPDDERHLTQTAIRRLAERGAVIGVVPFGRFLRPGWSRADDPNLTTLDHLLAHIDALCQAAGDARHAAIGSDFDGGWGWPYATREIDTAADLQKLVPRLAERGYAPADIAAILGGNWRELLERNLPA